MVATARAWLPAERPAPPPVNDNPLAGWLRQLDGEPSHADGPQIRKRVAAALGALATLVEPALTAAVRRARQAWDQADALVVLDAPALAEVATLRRWLAVRAAAGRTETAATALEGLLVLDAAVALIRLFEHRLAALLRLQLRSNEPELLPRERPFLDLAAALREAERAWR
ncbi:MAG TPA: hypothetical protein VGP07_01660 [Polyangia bacterium]|jgi:hypothetical protein